MARLTKLSAEELEAFFLLQPRILHDHYDQARGPFNFVYVYSETPDNEQSGLAQAVEMARQGMTKKIGICRGDTSCGYAGFDHSIGMLHKLGFGNIVPIVPIDVEGNVNTGTEAEALIRHCGSLYGNTIGIIAPPFHLVRAFMTTVSAMVRLDRRVYRVYAIAGAPLPWDTKVTHSQGSLVNTRAGLLGDELTRLEKYRGAEYGSMLSAQAVLDYLDWRD